MSKLKTIPAQIIANVSIVDKAPRRVGAEFRRLLESGHALKVDGQAKSNPGGLLSMGYTPKYEIRLFDTRLFLCNLRNAHDLKLMPAYVLAPTASRRGKPPVHARVFYKDSSLVWRSPSHYINTPDEQWIGKGSVKWLNKKNARGWYSAEETTNLPFELQAALDDISQRSPRAREDERILFQILHNAPTGRLRPYRDFEAPRERAMKQAANRINNNRPIAWFNDEDVPESLQFEAGYEPDFSAVIDQAESRSAAYGGDITKYRITSLNRRIQYMFVAGPQHVWIVHPQALTTELSSYGLRTVDVNADEDLCIPGYEFFDNTGKGEVDDQIPAGFAGPVSPFDEDRADASPWNDRLPVVKAFRRARLKRLTLR